MVHCCSSFFSLSISGSSLFVEPFLTGLISLCCTPYDSPQLQTSYFRPFSGEAKWLTRTLASELLLLPSPLPSSALTCSKIFFRYTLHTTPSHLSSPQLDNHSLLPPALVDSCVEILCGVISFAHRYSEITGLSSKRLDYRTSLTSLPPPLLTLCSELTRWNWP